MRQTSWIQSLIVFILAAGFGYLIYIKDFAHPVPCAQPITYKIGSVDSRFGVTATQLQADLAQAADIWSAAAGKKLFVYDANGDVPVNLVFDSRQETTQTEKKLNTQISRTGQSAASVKAQFTADEAAYRLEGQAYSAKVAQFNADQDSYNTQVQQWNSRGGASGTAYDQLNQEKSSLDVRRTELQSEKQALDAAAAHINAEIAQYNSLVGDINEKVDTINNDGLTGTEFEEGLYLSDASGQRINIYQFDSQTTFIRVLAHELGHALGLEHDAGTGSIMNPVNSGSSLSLSAQDAAELKAQCNLP